MSAPAKKIENLVEVHPGRVEKKVGMLEGVALKSLLSPYWDEGFKQDTHRISHINVDGNKAKAICNMTSHFTSPTDPRFHLSIFNAVDFICQVGIAHALYLNNYNEKTVEVLMTDIQVTLTKQVYEPKEIPIDMEIFGRSTTAPGLNRKTSRSFYKWKFDVANGLWWGNVTLCFPFG